MGGCDAGIDQLLDQAGPVNAQAQCLAHPCVIEGRLAMIDQKIVEGERRCDVQLVGHILLQPRHLVGRKVEDHVQLAGPKAVQTGCEILGGIIVDAFDSYICRVEEFRILVEPDIGLGDPLGQLIGAIGDHAPGPGPLPTKFLDHMPGHRRRRVGSQQLGKVGRGCHQLVAHVPVIIGIDAQLLRLGAAADDVPRAFNRIEKGGEASPGRRIHQAPARVHEVPGRHGPAVGPTRVIPQSKGIAGAVVTHRPGFSDTEHRLAGCIEGGEPHEQVVENGRR